ncbi:hypothetical protein Tco_1174441 [Tanacetum coccineum]
MLVQPTEDEGDTLERQYEPLHTSPPHLSETIRGQTVLSPDLTYIIFLISIPDGSSGNYASVSHPVIDSLLGNEGGMILKVDDASICGETAMWCHKEKESAEKGVSTKHPLSTAQPKVSNNKPVDSTDKTDEGTDKPKVSTDKEEVSTDKPDKARLNADKILVKTLRGREREMFYTIEQESNFLYDTIAAQRRFLAQQRLMYKNKLLQEISLRNQMMTYYKHVDEKVIKEMNEQVANASKKRVKKDDSIKGEIKEEEGTRKRKLGIRKKMKSKKRKFTSKDDEELRLCLTIVSDEDKEVDYEILDKKYPIIEWRSEYLTTKPQYDETEEIEDVYLNVVIRSNRQRRYFSTLMAVLSILDRDDICAIYQLVMNKYKDETPEGFDKILWGDLIIIFLKKQIAELEPKDSDGDEKDL